jgi:hypothetical protein
VEPHRLDKGRCQILRGRLVRLEYLPSPTTHGVAAPASEMPDLRPTHQTDDRLCLRACRAETGLWWKVRARASARRTEVGRATRSRSVGVGRTKMLRCGRPGSREVWRDTGCEAGECEYNQRKLPIFVSRVYERRTCLRRESMSSSFCLIWARRYSRLLKGKNEHSSSSGEAVDGEGARETTQSSILGKVKKVRG